MVDLFGVWAEVEFLIRLLIAGICGALVGYERKSRLKEAGIRTHLIVALASSLMMLISKYGFGDLAYNGMVSHDPSRIASTIVSGIGFLGAGMIFVRKNTINGLTTAAGVWATAGIGMAIGAGMYFVGIAATLIVLAVQVILHKNLSFLHIPTSEEIRIIAANDKETVEEIQNILERNQISILNIKIERRDSDGDLSIDLVVKLPQKFEPSDLLQVLQENTKIKIIEF